MKIAVVGCGGMGRVHALEFAKMPNVELVGVCDIVPELAESLARQTGTSAFASFDAMMSSVKADIVSVAVPSYLHKELVIQAAAAGKHVICEKPIALNVEDAEEMVRVCEANGVQLFVGHVVRFFPEYAQIKHQIDAGQIGKVGVANAKRVGAHPGNVKAWYKDTDKSGGVIVDLMVHDIDFMRWTLGEVKSVYAMNKYDDDMDYALVTLVFESGAVANMEGFWGYPGSFHYAAEFAGTAGLVQSDSLKAQSLQIRKSGAEADGGNFVEIPQSPGYRNPYTVELEHFIGCIRDGIEPIVTAWDACRALNIAAAAQESIRTGKAVLL
ncbi:Gfo/Idh/MocA family protein [Paenibacillus apiarius]|uniref:Gfo/Idh/MocA family protein n=1 Tax=Paenibacillus apiarius TaxID=46240 RepID=UPI0019806FF7|nr:Gfo/Idh/MocA family oxidoreductase [Paenibacillus apiarius]MBN3524716.1 Gfo/Idh/MocA family oxidoreductase [Paenibacillus apiarius]